MDKSGIKTGCTVEDRDKLIKAGAKLSSSSKQHLLDVECDLLAHSLPSTSTRSGRLLTGGELRHELSKSIARILRG